MKKKRESSAERKTEEKRKEEWQYVKLEMDFSFCCTLY